MLSPFHIAAYFALRTYTCIFAGIAQKPSQYHDWFESPELSDYDKFHSKLSTHSAANLKAQREDGEEEVVCQHCCTDFSYTTHTNLHGFLQDP